MKLILFIFLNLILITSIFSTATILEVIPDPKNSRVDTNETERVNLLILENQSIWNSFINYEDIESINNFTYNITHINNFINSFNFSVFNETLQFESLETNLEQNYFDDTQVYSDDEIEDLLLENIISQNTLSTPLVTSEIDESFFLNEKKTITIEGEYFSTNNNLNAISDGYIINPVNISPKEYVLEVTSPIFEVPKTSYTLSAHNFWGNGVEILFETIRSFKTMNIDTELSYIDDWLLDYGDHFQIYEQNGNTYAIFIGSQNNYLTIYDITDSTNPQRKSYTKPSNSDLNYLRDIAVTTTQDGKVYALVAGLSSDSVALYDITNPLSISLKDVYSSNTLVDKAEAVSLISTSLGEIYGSVSSTSYSTNYITSFHIENNQLNVIDNEWMGSGSNYRSYGNYLYEQNGEIYSLVTLFNDEIKIYKVTENSYSRISTYKDSSLCDDPYGASVFEKNDKLYAIIKAVNDRYFCVLDITDPANIVFETSFGHSEARYSDRVYAYEKNNQYFVAAPYYSGSTEKIYIYEITDFNNIETKVEKDVSSFDGLLDTQFYESNGGFYLLAFSAYNGRFYIYNVTE